MKEILSEITRDLKRVSKNFDIALLKRDLRLAKKYLQSRDDVKELWSDKERYIKAADRLEEIVEQIREKLRASYKRHDKNVVILLEEKVEDIEERIDILRKNILEITEEIGDIQEKDKSPMITDPSIRQHRDKRVDKDVHFTTI